MSNKIKVKGMFSTTANDISKIFHQLKDFLSCFPEGKNFFAFETCKKREMFTCSELIAAGLPKFRSGKFLGVWRNLEFSSSFDELILAICLHAVSTELTPPISFKFEFSSPTQLDFEFPGDFMNNKIRMRQRCKSYLCDRNCHNFGRAIQF